MIFDFLANARYNETMKRIKYGWKLWGKAWKREKDMRRTYIICKIHINYLIHQSQGKWSS